MNHTFVIRNDGDEPLKLELRDFVDCVQTQRAPVVSGESAQKALELAIEISRQVQAATETIRQESRPIL